MKETHHICPHSATSKSTQETWASTFGMARRLATALTGSDTHAPIGTQLESCLETTRTQLGFAGQPSLSSAEPRSASRTPRSLYTPSEAFTTWLYGSAITSALASPVFS